MFAMQANISVAGHRAHDQCYQREYSLHREFHDDVEVKARNETSFEKKMKTINKET